MADGSTPKNDERQRAEIAAIQARALGRHDEERAALDRLHVLDRSEPEVETRLAEAMAEAIAERPPCHHGSNYRDFCAVCDAEAALPVVAAALARVRTDTIDQCAESVAATCGCHDYLDGCRYCADSVAAVRGVSHEH